MLQPHPSPTSVLIGLCCALSFLRSLLLNPINSEFTRIHVELGLVQIFIVDRFAPPNRTGRLFRKRLNLFLLRPVDVAPLSRCFFICDRQRTQMHTSRHILVMVYVITEVTTALSCYVFPNGTSPNFIMLPGKNRVLTFCLVSQKKLTPAGTSCAASEPAVSPLLTVGQPAASVRIDAPTSGIILNPGPSAAPMGSTTTTCASWKGPPASPARTSPGNSQESAVSTYPSPS